MKKRDESFKKTLKERISNVLQRANIDAEFFKSRSFEELLEEISIYHQELEYQNEELRRVHYLLEESKNNYADLYDEAPVGYVVFNESYQILSVNRTFANMVGKGSDELVGLKITEFVCPQNQDDFYVFFREHKNLLLNKTISIVVKTNDKSFPAKIDSNRLQSDGQLFYRCSFTDISTEEQLKFNLQERIKEQNRLLGISNIISDSSLSLDQILQQVVDFIPNGFRVHDKVGAQISIKGKNYQSDCFSKCDKGVYKRIPILLNSDEEGEFAVCFCEQEFCDREAILKEEENMLTAVAKQIAQLVEYRNASGLVEMKERYYRSILHGMHEDIMVIDENYIIRDINNSFLKTIGSKKEDVLGKTCYQVSHRIDKPCSEVGEFCELKKVFKTEKSSTCLHEHIHSSGNSVYVDIIFSPLKDETGKVTHVIEAARDITEVVQTKRAIKESEEKFRLLVSQMQQGLALHEVIKDEKGQVVDYRFLEVNNSFERLTGLKSEEIIGKTVLDILPKTEKKWIKIYGNVATTGQPVQFEDYSRELKKYFNVDAYSPKPNQFAVIITDISDKKITEKALRVNEERYRSLFENSHAVMLIIEPKSGEIVDVNSAAQSFYGWSRGEMKSMNINQINTLTDKEIKKELALAALDKRRYFIFKHRLKNSSIRDVEVFSGPVEMGGQTLLYSFVHDITEKKQAEGALKLSENKYRKLAETTKTIFWEFDPKQNRWTYISPQVEDFLGYSSEEWADFDFWANRIHQEDREWVTSFCIAATEKGEDHEMEYRFIKPNGEIVWIREEVNIAKEEGKVKVLRGTMMDITARKRAEIALKESEANLKEAQRIALLGRWELDIVNNKLHWSDTIFEIFEIDANKFGASYEAFLETIYPEDREKVNTAYNQSLCEKSPYTIEHRLLMPDGRIKWVVESCYNQWNEDDEPIRSIGIVQDITSRKLIELALKSSEQKFQALFNNLSVGVSLISPQMELLEINPKIREWFPNGGYENNPFCYCVFSSANEDKPCKECPVVKTFQDGKVHETERFRVTHNGDMYFRVVSTPIFDERGEVIAAVEMLDNITKRKLAEIALLESEEKHRTLFETMEQGVVYQDENGNITSANQAAQRILGLSLDQMQDRKSTDPRWRAIKEDGSDFPGHEHPAMVALKTGKPVTNKIMGVFHPKEDEYRWILVNAVPEFRDGGEKPIRVYTTFTDITQRKVQEEEIKEQKDFLETLMQTIPNPVFYKDIGGSYIGCNRAFEDFFGYKKDDIIGKTVYDMETLPVAEKYDEMDQKLFRKSGNQHYEWTVQRKNGEIRDALFDKATLHDLKGNVTGIIGVITDITDRKKAEKDVRKNAERLKSLVRIFEHRADSVKDLLDFALTEALNLTSSTIGYIYLYDDKKEQFVLNSWSKNVMDDCSIINPQTCYELSKTGIWGEVVRQRKEIVVNDFQAKHPLKKGYPEGHAQLDRYMSIPVIIDEKIVAVVGVGNKTEEYNETDLNQLKLLMGSVWGIVQRREDSEKISKLSIAVEQSSASVVITDIHGTIEYVNPKFTEITGYTFDEAVGKNPRVLNSGYHNQEVFENLWQTILSGEDWKGQLVNKKKDGDLYWESASISPVFNASKEITNFIAIKEDITELKKAEEALRDSELKLRRMIEQAPDGIMLTDENGRVVAWNKALEEITQVPAEKALKLNVWDFHELLHIASKNGRTKELAKKVSRDLLSKGMSSQFEVNTLYEVKAKSGGNDQFIQLMVFVIPSEKGNMLASFVRDITKQKLTDLAIKEREEKLQAIFDNSAQSFLILSPDLKVQAFNHMARERSKFFFNSEFEVGKSVHEVYPKSQVELIRKSSKDALKGKVTRTEFIIKDNMGNEFWYEYHLSPVFDDAKNVVGVFINSIDITQRKLAEESMSRALDREKELNQLKSRFVATVSHEFRTPLASIYSNTQLLHRYHQKWEEEKKDLSFRRIYESVNIMTGMLENVSLIGKDQSGNLTFRPQLINLNEFVAQMVEESELTLGVKDVVNLTIDGEYHRALIDRVLIRHVLVNILTNAIKYSKGMGSVEFNISKVKRFIKFTVQDFGVGIPNEDLKNIFDPFFRASNSEEFKGTGLGMSIVKQCVDIHGGVISVKSELNKGTIVTVELPLRAI